MGGAPDALQLKELEKPAPKANEVLIRVCAASINSYDWRGMRGEPFLVHLMKGLCAGAQTRRHNIRTGDLCSYGYLHGTYRTS
jgi:threonine dehydrogenase-like Zn-dependent dehydrogenase